MSLSQVKQHNDNDITANSSTKVTSNNNLSDATITGRLGQQRRLVGSSQVPRELGAEREALDLWSQVISQPRRKMESSNEISNQ